MMSSLSDVVMNFWFSETNNFGDTRSGSIAGPLALPIILLLAAATVLLVRNMNKRLRRLPQSFDAETSSTDSDEARPHS